MLHSVRQKGHASAFGLALSLLILILAAGGVAGCGGTDTGAAASSPAPTVTATVTASPAASPTTTSDTGEPSATVMALQSDLKKAGYYKGKLTGVYDAATGAAVQLMEEALKVKGADAQYDAKTYAAQKASGVQNLTAAFVKQIQVAMQQLGYYKGNIDGVYGANTVTAVRAFQSSVGLPADGVAGPKTIAAYEVRIKGDSTVATLQQELTNWGYYHGAIDGIYGPGTVQAVTQLQTALGVTPADGQWGPKTQAAVNASHKNNGKGTTVTMQIQSDLATLGYYHGAIDGVYGPATIAAVKAFQKAGSLPVDGIVGVDTMTAIQMEMKALHGG
jgi:peptidoglycan hydrolase-like protein with peptidoglycan-binding domain